MQVDVIAAKSAQELSDGVPCGMPTHCMTSMRLAHADQETRLSLIYAITLLHVHALPVILHSPFR